ncbi:MAG: hypothetical protein IPI03_03260 [Rubrivivax sp.]|nr:hypothetical protein [Rubrivivax sp.]
MNTWTGRSVSCEDVIWRANSIGAPSRRSFNKIDATRQPSLMIGSGLRRSTIQSGLNNPISAESRRHWHPERWRNEQQRQHELPDEGALKRPQVRQDHPQVVTFAAQHRVHRVTQGALQPIPVQQPIGLHVADHRFDHLAPFEQLLQILRQPPRCG